MEHNARNIKKRLGVWALIVAVILMIPLVGNWPWTGSDFACGGVLLFGSAAIYEFATKEMVDQHRRMMVGASVFFVLAFVWVFAATGFERFLG